MIHANAPLTATGRLRLAERVVVDGRGNQQVLAGKRARKQAKVGYTYLHTLEDGFSRLSYTEPLDDEKASTTIGFFHRARAYFAAHGTTRITRLVTDNGKNYIASAFQRSIHGFVSWHQRIRIYTPRHNGKVERYQRTLAEECLYAHEYESEAQRREQIAIRDSDDYNLTLTLEELDRPMLSLDGNGVVRRMWWTSEDEPSPRWVKTSVTPADLERVAAVADMAAHAQQAFGERLIAVAIANEPNGCHQHRFKDKGVGTTGSIRSTACLPDDTFRSLAATTQESPTRSCLAVSPTTPGTRADRKSPCTTPV